MISADDVKNFFLVAPDVDLRLLLPYAMRPAWVKMPSGQHTWTDYAPGFCASVSAARRCKAPSLRAAGESYVDYSAAKKPV